LKIPDSSLLVPEVVIFGLLGGSSMSQTLQNSGLPDK